MTGMAFIQLKQNSCDGLLSSRYRFSMKMHLVINKFFTKLWPLINANSYFLSNSNKMNLVAYW